MTVPSAFPDQHIDHTYIEELSVCVFLLESVHGNARIENIPVSVRRNYVENGRNQISLPFFFIYSLFRSFTIASQVAFPITPSILRSYKYWNCCTIVVVLEPYMPSTGIGRRHLLDAAISFRYSCILKTEMPCAPELR